MKRCVKCFLFSLITVSCYFFHIKFVSDPPNHIRHFTNKRPVENYKGFDFDRANWTVKLKVANLDTDSERELKFLIQEEKVVKRIIHFNGTIENLGCKHNTKRCSDVMQFDSKHKIRMNTPPCCKESLLLILKHFTEEFRRLGVDHFLAYGGVIGWIRYEDMIPYDLDFDVLVDARFWNTPLMKRAIEKMKDVYGHDTVVMKGGNKLWVAYSKINRNHIDIWPYKRTIIHNRWMISIPPGNGGAYHPPSSIFPLKNVTFSGMPMYIPHDPVTFLNEEYGIGNWEEEISCQTVVNGKCMEYPTTLYRLFGIY